MHCETIQGGKEISEVVGANADALLTAIKEKK
jgi:hypothetical protein